MRDKRKCEAEVRQAFWEEDARQFRDVTRWLLDLEPLAMRGYRDICGSGLRAATVLTKTMPTADKFAHHSPLSFLAAGAHADALKFVLGVVSIPVSWEPDKPDDGFSPFVAATSFAMEQELAVRRGEKVEGGDDAWECFECFAAFAPPSVFDFRGRTPLFAILWRLHEQTLNGATCPRGVEQAMRLVAMGADAECVFVGALDDDVQCALVLDGGDREAHYKSHSPLSLAIKCGFAELVDAMISAAHERGRGVATAATTCGIGALTQAIDIACVGQQYLGGPDAPVDDGDRACQSGLGFHMLIALLDQGANPNQTDLVGVWPRHCVRCPLRSALRWKGERAEEVQRLLRVHGAIYSLESVG